MLLIYATSRLAKTKEGTQFWLPYYLIKFMKPVTPQEKRILELIAQGLTTKDIAGLLEISFHTVQVYRKSLLRKFDANNAAELTKKASDHFNDQQPLSEG
jgi:DNA-binding NarL/FixJ family response regulator